MTSGAVTLVFPDKFTSDQTEKSRGEVEASISEALGQATRVTFSVGGSANGTTVRSNGATVRSEVGQQSDAAAADRKAPRERGPPASAHPQRAGRVRRRAQGDQNLMSIPDLKGLLETAQRIQTEVARVREELARKTVVGETGGGLCRCTANGKGEILSIVIDDAIVGDKKMIEDLAAGAVNIALQRAREMADADLAQVTGGLPVPPGMFGA